MHSLYTHYALTIHPLQVHAAREEVEGHYALTMHSLYTHYTLTIHPLQVHAAREEVEGHYAHTMHSLYTHYRYMRRGRRWRGILRRRIYWSTSTHTRYYYYYYDYCCY
jgi:hypothetical protein